MLYSMHWTRPSSYLQTKKKNPVNETELNIYNFRFNIADLKIRYSVLKRNMHVRSATIHNRCCTQNSS